MNLGDCFHPGGSGVQELMMVRRGVFLEFFTFVVTAGLPDIKLKDLPVNQSENGDSLTSFCTHHNYRNVQLCYIIH